MMHETNDPRCLPVNLMIVLGTWLAGGVERWGLSLQSWFWNDARFSIGDDELLNCAQMPPDLIFRQALEAVSLGAQHIEFAPDNMIWKRKGENSLELARQYREGIRPLFEILDKGVISPPSKDRIMSFSPLALRLTANNPTYIWRDGLFCPGDPRITPESKNLPTADTYLPRYIYGEEKLFRGILLKTPYGVVPILPPWAREEQFDEVFDTDSKEVVDPISGERKKGPDACRFLTERLKAKKMPVSSYDVGLHFWKEDDLYKVVLIKSLFSQLEEAELYLRLQSCRIEDAETGKLIAEARGKVRVRFSPKGHRILNLRRRPNGGNIDTSCGPGLQ